MSIGTIGRSLAWLVTALVLAAAVFFAAHTRRTPETAVVRGYDINPEIAAEMKSALQVALSPFGQVTLSPSGQILVRATPSEQEGVAQILKT